MDFTELYRSLNTAQKEAVDTIEGPLLVIAGPGTGKTQLLSARVANILQKTDTLPQNILCLTFTENGALNMRDRLTRFIGQAAYDVNISTYHAFGGDLIRRYPQYFVEHRMQNPVDELGKHQIVQTIVEAMHYTNPLKQTRHHLGDLIGTISEVKRALLTSEDLQAIATQNLLFLQASKKDIAAVFEGLSRMPSKAEKSIELFSNTLDVIQEHEPAQSANETFGSLANVAAHELAIALEHATQTNSTKPLTAWKNSWLVKNADNQYIIDGELQNQRMAALAIVLEQYQAALGERGLYDFDDMIIRAIQAMEQNLDLKYTLQEQYLYILLDEFQDTNAAQLKLVELLTDNPVSNGRPNVMAVGDDDQAIYAFQGAQYSNMVDFYELYKEVALINLTENYRSHTDILETAGNIAGQIEARLNATFADIDKSLVAANTKLPKKSSLQRTEFMSAIAQYDWIAEQIQKLIDSGTSPSEIAVLAPRHKQLEPLVPYLNARGVPVRYEKRENILETPVIRQIITMCRLVMALHDNNQALAASLWPEVLSFEFWHLPVSEIWKLSWRVADSRGDERVTWTEALLDSGDGFRAAVLLFLSVAGKVETETVETLLDDIMGNAIVSTDETDMPKVTSPLRDHYTGEEARETDPELFYQTLSHLIVLRARLREYAQANEAALTLQDFLTFIGLYEMSETPMTNTSPYNQQADAVQLMTIFKAKGLEFEHVFLPSCQDDVWGSSARGNSNKITLPANLAPIRHAGANDDERLRMLFVAVTRARFGLHLTSFLSNYAGKLTKRVKYLNEQEQEDGTFKTLVLPENAQNIHTEEHSAPAADLLQIDWRGRHTEAVHQTTLRDLLSERLESYQLSPTHLNTFVDLEYAGPERFFFSTLLRFPQAPTIDSQFGNAVHETLEWIQQTTDKEGSAPPIDRIHKHYDMQLERKRLSAGQYAIEQARGHRTLTSFMVQRGGMFRPGVDKAEANFRNENVHLGEVWMGGKIDRLEIDREKKTITVVDYKTGHGFDRWESSTKLHKYKQQLYCYKLLIEHSRSYRDYEVTEGRLEFVEPTSDGKCHALTLKFEPKELERTKQLITALWQHVHALDFPDITEYAASLSGIKEFEDFLLDSITSA
jgi:DNA helicase-2/ATP-dependent DNA helicase PcrA